MIDLLEIKIPFDSSLVTSVDGRHMIVGFDYELMGIPMGAKSIYWRDDGSIGTSCLYHPYESLPTSYSGMALKVHLDGFFFPHVTLKASPAKILQGHNVFGFDDMGLSVTEMLYWLQEKYPSLFGILAIQEASILKMDITYTSKIDSPKKIRQFIDYMSRVSNGQSKPTKSKKYETTCYWGGQTSRLIRQKLYAKWDEYEYQLQEMQNLAKKGDPHAKKIVSVMANEQLIAIARQSVRWECTFMSRWLERNNYPTNVWQFIKLERTNKGIYQELWKKGFAKIKEAIQGQTMKYVDDEKLLEKMKSVHGKVLDSGKISYRKAINLYSFYNQLKAFGYQELKDQKLYSVRRFNELISDLIMCGFSKAYLQNLHIENDETKIIPFVDIINVDFSEQVPDWYEKPVSTPEKLGLIKVA